MRIAVLMKQVPWTDSMRIDPEKGTIIREGVELTINPLDCNALEEALRLRALRGGEVVVLSMGPPKAEEALREALSLGADKACLLTDSAFAGADTRATARVLSRACEIKGPFDLILAGERSTDGGTGHVGPAVAAFLKIPWSTRVSHMKLLENHIRVERNVEEGRECQRLPFPCLLTVLHHLNTPFLPTLGGKKRARRASVEVLSLKALSLAPEETGLQGSSTKVVEVRSSTLTGEPLFFGPSETSQALDYFMEKLRELALL